MLLPRSAKSVLCALTLTLPLAALAQTNTQATGETRADLKQDRKAEKAQAHADKKERKALNSHAQKKADKAQDKADRKAAAVPPTQ